jgi:hypothetical protein
LDGGAVVGFYKVELTEFSQLAGKETGVRVENQNKVRDATEVEGGYYYMD